MEWITRLSGGEVVELSVGDADQVLGVGRLIREEDTKISGPIRIVEVDGLVADSSSAVDCGRTAAGGGSPRDLRPDVGRLRLQGQLFQLTR